jgi:hypothetical protein
MKENFIFPISANALLSSRSRLVAEVAGSVGWASACALLFPVSSIGCALRCPFAIAWPHNILIPDVLSFLIIGVSPDDLDWHVRVFFVVERLYFACRHLCNFMIHNLDRMVSILGGLQERDRSANIVRK